MSEWKDIVVDFMEYKLNQLSSYKASAGIGERVHALMEAHFQCGHMRWISMYALLSSCH